MRILLINPPHSFSRYNPLAGAGMALPPLGLLYIAAYLRKELPEAELKVIDCPALKLSAEDFEAEVKAFRPDLAGVTVYTGTFTSSANAAAAIKKIFPHCFVAAGGPHATARPAQCLEKEGFDAVIAGEGERAFAELAVRLAKGLGPDGIGGLVLKKRSGSGETAARYAPLDLDTLPMPARDLVDLKLYRPAIFGYKRFPVTSMVTSRGCPFTCGFCSKSVFGDQYRAQSPERTLGEILWLIKDYGIREISFQDDTFTLDRERVMKLCALIKENGLNLTWSCMTRVDLVDGELLKKMREIGCVSIAFGIDGASDGACGLMGKGFKMSRAREAVLAARNTGIETRGYYVFGYPGETPVSMKAALKNIMEIDTDHVFFAFAHPFFDTRLYAEAKERDLLLAGDDELCDSYDNTQPLIKVRGAESSDLLKFCRRAYLRYYLRPSRLFNIITSVRSAGDLAGRLKALGNLLKKPEARSQ
ncbi:MAG: radical SAM protein [Elusimicrobia bacterium]|nr:radical SAM protein [Elusimicrobiota bacterium]